MSTAIVTDAAEINREHQLARQAASNAVSHAIRCGELLAARKGELPHGEFMNWVGGHCDFAYSTASRYMKAAAESSTGVEISTLSELFLSGRGAATPAPEPASVSTEQEHDGIPQRFVGFGRKMAELDETIERHAAHLAADIKLEMRGLTAAEQSSLSCMLRRALENGQFAARVPGHELLPLRSGCVTIGAVAGSADRWVLSESRKHPGFWHDIDLHDGTTSDRPVRPLGMAYRFLRSPHELRWRTANEDGAFASFVDQPRGREVSQP